jgi:hypothetical protein
MPGMDSIHGGEVAHVRQVDINAHQISSRIPAAGRETAGIG